jgi:hypothetical protein
MSNTFRLQSKLGLLSVIALVLALAPSPEWVHAQEPWPPFWFDLSPSTYQQGKITYRLELYSRVAWPMPDLTIKVPLPAGTRFLEANAEPGVSTGFDGREVTFAALAFNRYIEQASFTVEVTDPNATIFTTQGWISWKGDHQGDYLAEEVRFDITRKPLNWTALGRPRLQLGLGARVGGDTITYLIYPKAVGRERMWDVRINIPLPKGTAFLSVDAPPPFSAGFSGQEVSFSTLELERQAEIGPLSFKVSTAGVTDSTVTTHVWAAWKNGISGEDAAEAAIPPAEEYAMDLDVVEPHVPQQIMFDMSGDVPFPEYDLTSIAFREDDAMLLIVFNTAGAIGPEGQPGGFVLYIDSDCNVGTGSQGRNRGAEYRVSYNHQTGRAMLAQWDEAQKDWRWEQASMLDRLVGGQMVMVSVPESLIGPGRQFCWVSEAANRTTAFYPDPPEDWVPDAEESPLTRYEMSTSPTGPRGKLAVPFYNERGSYNVHIFSLPDGQEINLVTNARQPSFRRDGRKLLFNHESNEREIVYEYTLADGRTFRYALENHDSAGSIYEYNIADGTETQVSDNARDAHPFYNPRGDRVAYDNTVLAFEPGSTQLANIFVQCGLLPPHQEHEERCWALAKFGMLILPASAGAIQGSHPVWADNDKIIYSGCREEANPATCGIYAIDAQATAGQRNGDIPRRLTQNASDIPTDTKGDLVAFTSRREGNWEAYVMSLAGIWVRNLSESPNSNDGLPTLSPDGNWAAFVSDRSGAWAVWLVPVAGGPAQKLFTLPRNVPWGQGSRAWTNERISWGP